MALNFYSIDALNEYAEKKPDFLNDMVITGAKLDGTFADDDYSYQKDGRDGVFLEGMTVRNFRLQNSSMQFAHFKNMTFINCLFYKTDFTGSRFDNVKFIDCIFDGQEPGKVLGHETKLKHVLANNVTFDKVTFGAGVSVEFRNGSIITLRNATVKQSIQQYNSAVFGKDIHVRLVDCTVKEQRSVAVLHGDSTVYATNCKFEGRGITGNARLAFIDKSTIRGGNIGAQVLVIQNSTVSTSVSKSEFDSMDVYLKGNTYPNFLELFATGARNGRVYVYGGGKTIPVLGARGGSINLYDVVIGKFIAMAKSKHNYESLNMKNVIIREGSWPWKMPRNGNWENVQIYPPLKLREKSEYSIIGHNVTFPDGPPWVNGTVEIQESAEPLEFSMPPVPTAEQLGLTQFWEAVDRGESPDPPRGLQQSTGK